MKKQSFICGQNALIIEPEIFLLKFPNFFLLCVSQIHDQELKLLDLLPGVAPADLAVGHGAVSGRRQVVERVGMFRFLWQRQGGGARTGLLMKPQRRTGGNVRLVLAVGPELPAVGYLEFRSRHLLRDCGGFLIRNIKRLEVSWLKVCRGFRLLRCQRERWEIKGVVRPKVHISPTVALRELVVSKTHNQSGVSQMERMSTVAVAWINMGVTFLLKRQGAVGRTLPKKQKKASLLTWFC